MQIEIKHGKPDQFYHSFNFNIVLFSLFLLLNVQKLQSYLNINRTPLVTLCGFLLKHACVCFVFYEPLAVHCDSPQS